MDILETESDDYQVKPTAVSAMRAHHPARPGIRAPGRGSPTPAKLVVLAADPADTVHAAGGLIFDSVRAGWTVEVYLETLGAQRAFQILGVDARTLPSRFDPEAEWPNAVYVAAALYGKNRGVRRLIAETARRSHADIAVWGQGDPSTLDTGIGFEYRLSTAAQAFKVHAMNAAGVGPHVAAVEPFRRGVGR
jgi:hypothetical protein